MASDRESDDQLDDLIEYIYDDPYNNLPRRYLRDRQNPVEFYSEREFIARYRFSKETVTDVLLPMLTRANDNNRGMPIPPILKILTALLCHRQLSGK